MPTVLESGELMLRREGGPGQKGTRRFKRVWQTIVSDLDCDAGWVIANTPGLPTRGVPYLTSTWNDLGATVTDNRARNTAPHAWEIDVDYSSDTDNPAAEAEDPLLRPPKFNWSWEKYKIAPTVDQDGRAYVNSAEEAFDPAIEEDRVRLVLNYERNVVDYDELASLEMHRVVNENPWKGFGERLALIEDNRAEYLHENGSDFWRETFVIKIDKKGWTLQILDQGYSEIVGGARRVILDLAGRPISAPALLNGAGVKLAIGGTPVFIVRRPCADFDFDALGLTF